MVENPVLKEGALISALAHLEKRPTRFPHKRSLRSASTPTPSLYYKYRRVQVFFVVGAEGFAPTHQ